MISTTALNGTWELRWRDGQRGQPRGPLLEAGADMRRAIPAQVPGEVHLDLMRAGLIEDPAVGLNCLRARWVEETIWLYRRTFSSPALQPGERAWLVFEQLDLAATILLNGEEVARHGNVFHPLRVEVTEALREGENVLVVEIESGLFSVSERPWQGYGNGEDGRLHKRHWLRKSQSSFSWDWSQRLVNVGITGGVALEVGREVRFDRLVVIPDASADLARGTAMARVFVEGLDDVVRDGCLAVEIEGTGCGMESEVQIAPRHEPDRGHGLPAGPGALVAARARLPAPECRARGAVRGRRGGGGADPARGLSACVHQPGPPPR